MALLFADYARREPTEFNDLRGSTTIQDTLEAGTCRISNHPACRAIFAQAAVMS
jgi:hypothetical protein